jgi:hypothetical protein
VWGQEVPEVFGREGSFWVVISRRVALVSVLGRRTTAPSAPNQQTRPWQPSQIRRGKTESVGVCVYGSLCSLSSSLFLSLLQRIHRRPQIRRRRKQWSVSSREGDCSEGARVRRGLGDVGAGLQGKCCGKFVIVCVCVCVCVCVVGSSLNGRSTAGEAAEWG